MTAHKLYLVFASIMISILAFTGCIGQSDKFAGTWVMDVSSIEGTLGAQVYKIEKIENSTQYKVHMDTINYEGKVTPGGDFMAEVDKDNKDSNILKIQTAKLKNANIIYDPKEKNLEIPFTFNIMTGNVVNAKFKKTTKDESGIIEEILPALKENYEHSTLKGYIDASNSARKNYDGSKNFYKEK